MRIIIRADASKSMGSGHVMRSSVIAEEAIFRGIPTIFVGKIQGLDWVNKKISSLGFTKIVESLHEIEIERDTDVLVLDSYTISPQDPELSKKNWAFTVSISDSLTPSYDVDLTIKPSFKVISDTSNKVKILSGSEHMLIRRTILKKPAHGWNSPHKILVIGGGSDPFDFCKEIGRIIDLIDTELEVHFFNANEIQSSHKHHFVLHDFGEELDLIANSFESVISTASTSSIEFIAREIPIGIVCAVDNQLENYNNLVELGFAAPLGSRDESGRWKISKKTIEKYLFDINTKNQIHSRIKNLIDMKGAERVMDEIISSYNFRQIN